MSTSILFVLSVVLLAGALLAAWVGIRSIQSARTVVFYRTRNARMLAGWQWLAASLVMAAFAIAILSFGGSIVDRFLSLPAAPTTAPDGSQALSPTPFQTGTSVPSPSATFSISDTPALTSTTLVTPSRTPSYLGTYTALAVWTERRSTFIAMLSFTPTASRTPVPTWTRTPSPTPRPTYTASLTRTPRPTITHLPTHTSIPTWTTSPTRTPVTPSPTRTASPTRTPRPTMTPSPTRTTTPTRSPTP